MSELAFNLDGEPFELPPTATGWRVRTFKSKGAPEVVYGREGTPVVLPIDADMDDLRREARSEGRYRLDVVDEHSRAVAGAPPAYVCIHPPDAAPAPAGPGPAPVRNLAPLGLDAALIEAMRVNAAHTAAAPRARTPPRSRAPLPAYSHRASPCPGPGATPASPSSPAGRDAAMFRGEPAEADAVDKPQAHR